MLLGNKNISPDDFSPVPLALGDYERDDLGNIVSKYQSNTDGTTKTKEKYTLKFTSDEETYSYFKNKMLQPINFGWGKNQKNVIITSINPRVFGEYYEISLELEEV